MNSILRSIGIVAAALLSATSARAATLYASDSNGTIWTIDTGTFAVTSVGMTGAGGMTDLAFHNGQLYGVNAAKLYTIDMATGTASLVGATVGVSLNALATGPDGKLYGASNSTTGLYTVNPATGATSLVGSSGVYTAGDVASANGKLYFAGTNNSLYTLDTATGAATLAGNMGFQSVFGLAFAGGVMYGLDLAGDLLQIDLATGAASRLATTHINGWGLTAVPLPSALWLFGSAAFGALARPRRRRA
ncbi:MAG: hypothetical protein HY749_01880 [Gammaproteobacteria bacterium]|nr:hypothetical protein [Gammaproteobacteria bacterium]